MIHPLLSAAIIMVATFLVTFSGVVNDRPVIRRVILIASLILLFLATMQVYTS